MSWWPEILRKRTEDWIYAELAPDQVPPPAHTGDVDPEAAYLSVFLRSARVVDVRRGLKSFYGVVHSTIKLPHRAGDATFSVVVAPTALRDIDANRLDRVIQLNQRLLGPVPYVGGDLELEVGLFSVATADLVAPYLELLETLSRTAGVAFISAALPFVGPIVQGINLLAGGGDDTILEIGLSTTHVPPRQGHFVVVRAPKGSLEVADLRVDAADSRLVDGAGRPLGEYPYIVLEIRADPQRDDWRQIPELKAADEAIAREYRAGRREETEEALVAFRRIARTCDDLLLEDGERLAQKMEDKYLEQGPPRPTTRAAIARREFPGMAGLDLYGP